MAADTHTLVFYTTNITLALFPDLCLQSAPRALQPRGYPGQISLFLLDGARRFPTYAAEKKGNQKPKSLASTQPPKNANVSQLPLTHPLLLISPPPRSPYLIPAYPHGGARPHVFKRDTCQTHVTCVPLTRVYFTGRREPPGRPRRSSPPARESRCRVSGFRVCRMCGV